MTLQSHARAPKNAIVVAGVCAGLAALGGCEAVLGLGGLRGSGGSGGSGSSSDPWSCIGHVPPLPTGGTTKVTVQFLDLESMAPVTTALTVKLCSLSDLMCTSALSPPPTPLSAATFSVTVPSDFGGYLDVDDTAGTLYVPSLIFPDLVAAPETEHVYLISWASVMPLVKALKVPEVSGTGFVLVPTVDCNSKSAAGVSVDCVGCPSGSTRFYDVNGFGETGATQTDSLGLAGFVNVAPGDVTLTGTVVDGGTPLGQVGTYIRNGAMTWQPLRPTPTP